MAGTRGVESRSIVAGGTVNVVQLELVCKSLSERIAPETLSKTKSVRFCFETRRS